MATKEATRKCDSCRESVSVNATKCPHCNSAQLTSRRVITLTTIIGLLGLPFTYIALPIALSYGLPTGIAEGVGVGIVWGVAIVGPLFLFVALGGYVNRRGAVQNAEHS